jgi:RNA polymerase sigma-70 factor (family 1)
MKERLNQESELEDLKSRVALGDQHAFRDLFRIFSKKLIHFSQSIVKSSDAAREIVDEVFIRIWRNRETITDIQHLRVYLYTATKNTSLNYLSSRARENVTEPFDFFSVQLCDEQSPEKKLITSELLAKIHAAIDALPPRCKMVFKLVREDGLSYREVGQILNISSKTVDAQMVIAVRQISDRVQGDFDCFPGRNPKKK